MSKPDVVAIILLAGATLYAIFGGADFGAGVWELLAVRSRDRGLRSRIERRVTLSLGPVWEANHVWLIFTLVVLWTAFPSAFAPIMETLYLPLALAAVGIVLRGSGFAFGHTLGRGGRAARERRLLDLLADHAVLPRLRGRRDRRRRGRGGRIRRRARLDRPAAHPRRDPLRRQLLLHRLGVPARRLPARRRRGAVGLFPQRSVAAAVVTGALAAIGLVVLHADARPIFDGLLDEGLPFVIASAAARPADPGRPAARLGSCAAAVRDRAFVAIVGGWAVAQYPYLLPETLTVDAGAGAGAALTAMIVVFIAALVIVVPSLALLFRLAQRQALE